MSIKQKYGLLSTAVLSFCLGCQITLCTTFQTFWRRNFVTSLVPAIFSASKPFLHTACFTHNQMFSLGRCQGSFGVVSLRTLLDTFSGWASDILLSVLPLLWKELPFDWTGFSCSKGRSFLLEDSGHVTVVLSLFRLSGQFQVELPSRRPLKHSTGVRFHPCFCQLVCHCLHFCTFPSFSYFKSRQMMLKENSRGIQAPQGAQPCVCFTKRLRGRSCLHKARPRLLYINCRHSFQSCPTASISWFYVAMIMNVLAGWFSQSDYFLKWSYFWSNLVPIFSHNAVFANIRTIRFNPRKELSVDMFIIVVESVVTENDVQTWTPSFLNFSGAPKG